MHSRLLARIDYNELYLLAVTPGTTKQQFGNEQYDWGHLTVSGASRR